MRDARTGSAVVAANGTATVFVPGPRAFYVLDLSTVVVSSVRANATTYPTCEVYRAAVTPSGLLGTSRTADAVTFDASPGDRLLAGDQLIVAVANALPGSTVVVNVFGDLIPE